MICSCRGNGYIDEGAIEAQLGIPADDGGGEEEVCVWQEWGRGGVGGFVSVCVCVCVCHVCAACDC